MTIQYELEFFDYWHCGSGLSSGSDLDLLVIKDEDNMPFVPGKTIKGLLREAIEEINQIANIVDNSIIIDAFGESSKRVSVKHTHIEKEDEQDDHQQGVCFFRNAELKIELKKAVNKSKLSNYFYQSISSTALDDKGIAKEHSLRRMEVTIPCILSGEILHVPTEMEELFKKGLKYIKQLGQNRNRGLGRCIFYVPNKVETMKGGQQ